MAAKKASSKAPKEPQITWRTEPHGFVGTVDDITYRVVAGTAEDGGATWVVSVQLSDNEARSLEDAKQLAEDDLT